MAGDHHLLGRVSGLVAACTRRVSRATRRLLLLRRQHRSALNNNKKKKKQPLCSHPVVVVVPLPRGEDHGVALWSRRILMGERCQPLDFAGAIHYDSFGRRLVRPPTPRSASSLSLSCRSSDSIALSEAISYQLEIE
ncbi:hypothetical protein PR202_ga06128 [Eleusine coracana subsp. coracana]|uniref:Uncharacterized protein n=1 Tax=Eleusine coracana subsp. coracana TaxID=191504 RepID=A0AAV5BWG3_ELECO|nr:hypothetical protein QOZ80_5AG0361310 [Eleusine coracana subsp. coracana]GJM89903.1 hypothetical protein PR202_ga06128 [Eleusine coracana subsp. coracana]